MRIYLKHHNQTNRVQTDWIYLGNKYNKLEGCRKKIKLQNINLSEETRKIFNKYEGQYFEWIEKQRLLNKDSLEWWMTDIANGNTMISNLYLLTCQIKSLKNYLISKESRKNYKITIICEDIFVYNAVKDNLKNQTIIENKYIIPFFSFYEKFQLKLKSFFNLYMQIKYLFIAYYYSKITRPKKLDLPTGNIVLFHQPLHVNKLNKDYQIYGNYHKFLPSWFKRNNKNVFQICIDYELGIEKKTFFLELRNNNFFMPDDWLNIKDYFISFFRSLKCYYTLSYSIKYPELNIHQLIKRERYYQRFTKGLYYFRYIPAIKKWAKDTNSINYFDMYESTIYQHPLNQTINKLNKKNVTNGLIHHYVSKEYFGHYSHKNEWESLIKPHQILCHSKFYRDLLIKRNFPNQIIKLVPPIRSRFIQPERLEKNKNNLLVNLPLLHDALGEIISALSEINERIKKELNLNILLRPHPKTPESKIHELINKKQLPDNWKIVSNNFYDLLNETFCCLSMSSASVYDAINNFCIVISLKSEINIMDNYLDILEDEFQILQSVDKLNLFNKIKDVYFNRSKYYIREFDQIRCFLKKQSLELNEKNMKIFEIKNMPS